MNFNMNYASLFKLNMNLERPMARNKEMVVTHEKVVLC